MARKMTTKKADTTAKTASVKETPAKSVAAAPVENAVKAEPEKTENAKVTAVKEEEKITEKETPAKKTTRKTASKTAAPKKTPAKRTASKKAETNTEVYVQFWGREIHTKDVVENIKKVWTEEMGKKESDMKDLKVYIKPEDNGAHYVINGDITGFIGM